LFDLRFLRWLNSCEALPYLHRSSQPLVGQRSEFAIILVKIARPVPVFTFRTPFTTSFWSYLFQWSSVRLLGMVLMKILVVAQWFVNSFIVDSLCLECLTGIEGTIRSRLELHRIWETGGCWGYHRWWEETRKRFLCGSDEWVLFPNKWSPLIYLGALVFTNIHPNMKIVNLSLIIYMQLIISRFS
jgi:hypothetical protein